MNALGYLRVMFNVEDLDDTLARHYKLGAELVDEVVEYENVYRLCYIRGLEGNLIGLSQELGPQTSWAQSLTGPGQTGRRPAAAPDSVAAVG